MSELHLESLGYGAINFLWTSGNSSERSSMRHSNSSFNVMRMPQPSFLAAEDRAAAVTCPS